MADKTVKKQSVLAASVKMVLSLFLICAVTAGVVAGVNALTVDKINENLEAEIRGSIENMFGEGVAYTTLTDIPAGAEAIYEITSDGEKFYCVNLNSSGFGGDITMLVSIDLKAYIVGVSVVSHSETPGLGSRAAESSFLDLFKGKTLSDNVDSISGATISSTAVKAGISAAQKMLADAGLLDIEPGLLNTKEGGAD